MCIGSGLELHTKIKLKLNRQSCEIPQRLSTVDTGISTEGNHELDVDGGCRMMSTVIVKFYRNLAIALPDCRRMMMVALLYR